MKVSNLGQEYIYLSNWYFLRSNGRVDTTEIGKNITLTLIQFYSGTCLQGKDQFPLLGMDVFSFYDP